LAAGSDLTRRISSILDAVEREADRMLEDARAEAEQQIELARRQADGLVAAQQRRISELSGALVERVESILARLDETTPIRESFDRLVEALGHAADQLALEIEAPQAPGERGIAHAPGPPPPTAPRPVEEPEGAEATQEPAGVRHLRPSPSPADAPAAATGEESALVHRARQAVIQMAAAGTTRAQVAAHVRGSIGLANPEPLLDEIFGAGTADDARVPWAATS
jgi:vacuolar-type H+-ATPase subunit H